ncbi:MAG: EF-hand domain-containing protein [Xanthomonadaceae bacterium]|nr:EF-hand domain-containing protein [Xanthomonadaceae bacterium]
MPPMYPRPSEGSAPLCLRHVCAIVAALLFASFATLAQASRSEYLSWFDTDGDGRVSLTEYQDYLSQGFHAMDRNGDGVLSASEMPAGVRLRTATTLESRRRALTRMFDRLDLDNDGYLDANELTAVP